MASSALLLLVAMTACVTVRAVTERAQLESWNYVYYARNWAHVGSVTAMDLVQVHPASPMPDCRENVTFGFFGATTWVDKGCRGDFDVDIDDTDTMEQKVNQLINDMNDDAVKTENLQLKLDAQSKTIAELRCTVSSLNEDDPMHGCCCPAGWTEHHPDGKLICYRQATTSDDELEFEEAKALCKNLHPQSVLPMPKTAAQLEVLKSYMTDRTDDKDFDHVGMYDNREILKWDDGTAVDLLGKTLWNGNVFGNWDVNDGYYDCGTNYGISWNNDADQFFCDNDVDQFTVDGKQLCQLILNECDEAEQ